MEPTHMRIGAAFLLLVVLALPLRAGADTIDAGNILVTELSASVAGFPVDPVIPPPSVTALNNTVFMSGIDVVFSPELGAVGIIASVEFLVEAKPGFVLRSALLATPSVGIAGGGVSGGGITLDGPLDFAFFAPGLTSAIFSAGEFALADEQNPFGSVSLSIVFQAIPAVAEPEMGGGLILLATVALVLAWHRRREAA
jgi:hypothetical protein